LAGAPKSKRGAHHKDGSPKINVSVRGRKMNKSSTGLSKPRKEENEQIYRINELVRSANIFDIARQLGLQIDDEGMALCPAGHDDAPTLRIDVQSNSYRCLSPNCNAHGDVATFIQGLTGVSFEEALGVLAHGNGTSRWIEEHSHDLKTMGLIRDCMSAAARFYARSTDQVSSYLNSRGISVKTAHRFMIGSAMGKDGLKQLLLQRGFDEEIIKQTGLLNQYGHDRFQNHLVVPIFYHGQVVDFYGRILTDDEEMGKHWRLPSDRMTLGHSLFNWDPAREEVVVVEGIFDALSLIENGFENAVAVNGTNGLHVDLLKGSAIKKVYMCFDGDGPGRTQNLRRAYELKDSGLDVRIITFPEGQDPNEFLRDHPAQEFTELQRKSLYPEKWEIEHLGPELDSHDKIKSLENAMLRIREMEPMYRAALTKEISSKLGMREKDVREHIEGLPPRTGNGPRKEIIDVQDYELIHPALHHGSHGALITIPLMGKNPKTGRSEWQPWAVTSDRELFTLTHEELNRRGYYCNDILCPGRQRYNQQVIAEFVNGYREGDLQGTINLIKRIYQGYLDFSDPRTYDYLAAWTVGTYFFPIFNYYPYLHFTGTKEVGKSKAMKLMSRFCFNGIMSVSITDASQFRIVTELLPTLFLDETENLSDKTYSERRALLLGGYEKGSTAIRTEKVGDTFRAREYDNYSPRVFGSIEGLEDTLASRTVQIPMRRSYNEKIKEAEVELNNSIFQTVADHLFLVAMDYSQKIREIYGVIDRPGQAEFDAREWNLFKPILAVGSATGNAELIESLIGFANSTYRAKTDALNEKAVENVILRSLLEIVQQEDWYELDLIHSRVLDFIKEQGLNVGVLSKDKLGTLIHHLGLLKDKDRMNKRDDNSGKTKKITVYLIDPEKVRQVAVNYRVK
jgi:DNA primase catalytic core